MAFDKRFERKKGSLRKRGGERQTRVGEEEN
jgi:hypothetical protein